MSSPLNRLTILSLLLVVLCAPFMNAALNDVNKEVSSKKAAVIVCKGMIDDGLYKSIRRRTEFALNEGAGYLIYEIQTYGGLVDAADNISKYLILEVGKKAHTVAYVTSEAISAGAMISVSCRDIIMLANTTIGDAAPMTLGGKLEGVEREKAESFIRAIFSRAAEANGYPLVLLKAMVTMQTEVYRVKNLQIDEYEFFEGDQLPKDANNYDLQNKELIVRDSEILTLTASKALEYGIARATVADLQEALEFLAERDGVSFVGELVVLKTIWSEEMVRWLNSPAVMGVLVMLAMLGVYIELNSPGVGLPGLLAVLCFAIIIGSKYLVGLANWIEVALFVVGLLLLLVEIFVLPGFGIAGILGIGCVLAGLFGMLVKNPPDKLPWPESPVDWQIFVSGVWGLAIGFLAFVVLAFALTKYLPKLEFMSGLILRPSSTIRGGQAKISLTAPPESEISEVRPGDMGQVVSTLRPIGRARFDERIVDVVAQAEFLNEGTKVEIVEIHGNRVVVKAIEKKED